jgi:hypothetical protein
MRSEDEIYEQIDKALENDGRYPGMTYEQGVDAALRWAIGHADEPPMEDD